jgi:hypothetical protein
MKYLASVLAVVFIASRAFCGEGTSTANFYEIHSTTNLPPEVRSYVLAVLGSMGGQANDRKIIAEPGEPLTVGCRLIWGATDGNHYIVHYEFIDRWDWPDFSYCGTNYCITEAFRDPKDGKVECRNEGYSCRFRDYKDYISYESRSRWGF